MSKQRYASVWDAIEDTSQEAASMKVRSALMTAIREHLRQCGLTQAEAAKRLGVTQPRISDLMRGKVDLFSIDVLINMAAAAGLRVKLSLNKAA